MRRYRVGGAVRDRLLDRPVLEHDWVVTGATPEEMVALGYKPVGKDFPVFLHPQTKEEHALARTERKSGRGYHGFTVYAAPDVTLEQDLIRRDLTVNAMAEDETGALIDPYGGVADLNARLLRHVSDAFAEDPVRVLRTARFHSRYAYLGFSVAADTLALMRQMVEAGEVDHLTPERVWKETERALMQPQPSLYFTTLRECGALARLMPELDALFGVPQPAKHHPEIDTGLHVMLTLDCAARCNAPLTVRYAALCHDFGKALTPAEILPSHYGHEASGVPCVEAFSARLKVPADCRELALHVCREHLLVHQARELTPGTLMQLLERLDALRRPARFEEFLLACECDARGRTGLEDRDYPQPLYLREALKRAQAVQVASVTADGYAGAAIGAELRTRRIKALKTLRETWAV
ncbi:MAG: multifunctional CCA addition/repair protein [Gammaproteobacteria bacterium]|nr:multifunctional CCA addition/repair protein [Gammaproteobacteria bacterium]